MDMDVKRRAAIIIVCAWLVSAGCLSVSAEKIDGPCESPIFCQGPFLHAMVNLELFDDSKDYLDRPLRSSPTDVINAFNLSKGAGTVSKDWLMKTLAKDFVKVADDLEKWNPDDWKAAPEASLISRIKDNVLRDWASALHDQWQYLGRKTARSVQDFPDRHSLIHLPHPFIVHASGEKARTREQHYWESFWTIHGLLISEMYSTAKGMILNFAHLIDRFGYVPMGNRVYYQDRPQPPLLAAMLHLYWHHVKSDANALIKAVLPAITAEYDFWMRERSVDVVVEGKTFTLNRYKNTQKTPRPEFYREDRDSAIVLRGKDKSAKKLVDEKFFASMASASESGWEFSTRWLDDPSKVKTITDIRTEDILPVDLNAFLCLTEKHLAFFYELTGDDRRSQEYSSKAGRRGNAIRDVFWSEKLHMWRDYDLRHKKQREDFYMSSLTPLFAGCSPDSVDVMSADFLRRVVASMDVQTLTSYTGGMPASFVKGVLDSCRSCQWDFPNFWPPLSLFLIEPLSKVSELLPVARNMSQRIINALYREEGTMFEKYNVENPGMYGRGGEYAVMQGYGPTNGAVLRILEIFPRLKGPSNNEVIDEEEQADHHNDYRHNEQLSRDDPPFAPKSSPSFPTQKVAIVDPTAAKLTSAFATEKTVFPTKAEPVYEPVKRVRMDTTTAAAPSRRGATAGGPPVQPVNVASVPNVRLSKNVRDDSRNCQSVVSFSMPALIVCVITMFFC